MGVMDMLFRNTAAPGNVNSSATVAAPAPTGGGGLAVNSSAPAPIASTPAAPAPAAPAPPSSPLDAFTPMWDTPVGADGKPLAPVADPLATDIFNFDPAKVKEQAGGLDFVKDINPELLAQVTAGGPDAGPALLELLNKVQQGAFAAATLSTGRLINQATQANNARVKSSLPAQINAATLSHMPTDNPVLSHPAVQPLISALRVAEFNKNPNANPADVAKRVNDYVIGISTAVTANAPAAVAARAEEAGKVQDWGNYFGEQ